MSPNNNKQELLDHKKISDDTLKILKEMDKNNRKLNNMIKKKQGPQALNLLQLQINNVFKQSESMKQQIKIDTIEIKRGLDHLKGSKDAKIRQNVGKIQQMFDNQTQKFKEFAKQAIHIQQTNCPSYKPDNKSSSFHSQPDEQDQEQMQIYDQAQVDDQILQERFKEISAINNLVTELKEIMIDVAQNVDQQGQSLQIVNKQIQETDKNVTQAQEELNKASRKTSNTQKQYLCCIMIVILIICVVLALYFTI